MHGAQQGDREGREKEEAVLQHGDLILRRVIGQVFVVDGRRGSEDEERRIAGAGRCHSRWGKMVGMWMATKISFLVSKDKGVMDHIYTMYGKQKDGMLFPHLETASTIVTRHLPMGI